MPYNDTHKLIYGKDARKVPQWARGVFCAWLAEKLNDATGPYYDDLQLTSERKAVVTDNSKTANAVYSDTKNPPVVFAQQGVVENRRYQKRVESQTYEGQRYEITLELDMGISNTQPEIINDEPIPNDDATDLVRDDSLLASFVADAVRRGLSELDDLGLFNTNLVADLEKQRAGVGRYPHRLTFFCVAIEQHPAGWPEG